MVVMLRLQRYGNRNAPHYRIVVADKRFPVGGRFIEQVCFAIHKKNSIIVSRFFFFFLFFHISSRSFLNFLLFEKKLSKI